jgi:hypothetical protein
MKTYQIIRFKNNKQQSYNVDDKRWNDSTDRFSDTFEADSIQAKKIYKAVFLNARRTSTTTLPKLMVS